MAGNRISKAVTIGENTTTTWYSRDAQGNTLAVYEEKSEALSLTEHHLYGSSRLGLWARNIGMNGGVPDPDLERGNKFFELSNHLGNVLVTVSDRKTGVDSDSDGDIDFYLADVVTATDYAPFGMSLVNRSFRADGSYRYGFNGKEKDTEGSVQYDYGFRIYDPRLGRFLSVDPKANVGDNISLSPFAALGNNPILYIDPDGQDFGIKIDYTTKTIIFVSNIYTNSKQTFNQARSAAGQWNRYNKDGEKKISGYTIKFEVNVIAIPEPSFEELKKFRTEFNSYKEGDKVNKSEWAETKKWVQYEKLLELSGEDDIGNAYFGFNEIRGQSKQVFGGNFVGGITDKGKYTWMHSHIDLGNLGHYSDLVAHEIGHQLGLQDKGKAYYADGGIMEYGGLNLKKISDADVGKILDYAKDYLADPSKFKDRPSVKLLEEKGEKDPDSPLE